MKPALRLVLASAACLIGCRTTYHVVTAPVRLIHHPTPAPATADVTTPGTPVAPAPSPTPSRHVIERTTSASASPEATTVKHMAQATPKPIASPKPESAQFPVAKPVPNKPGYVFSPSDPTKYVDVTGYPSGSKVKDPYSGKIFMVP